MTLYKPTSPPPSTVLGDWMDAPIYTDFQRRLVRAALADNNKHESPMGTNRSPYIDALTKWAGSPLGSNWCAIWAGSRVVAAGGKVPRLFPACDSWIPYLVDVKSLPVEQRIGSIILYGVRGTAPISADVAGMKASGWDAYHIGIIAHWLRDPFDLVLTTEGNRGYKGHVIGGSPNNGIAIDTAPTDRKDVLGLIPWSVLL